MAELQGEEEKPIERRRKKEKPVERKKAQEVVEQEEKEPEADVVITGVEAAVVHSVTGAKGRRGKGDRISSGSPEKKRRKKSVTSPQPSTESSSLRIGPSSSSKGSATGSKSRKEYACNECDFDTDRKETFQMHMNKHLGITFVCQKCGKSYWSEKSLRNHNSITHERGGERCKCPEKGCEWKGKDYGMRKIHLFEQHNIGEPPACKYPECRKRPQFNTFRTLERHIKNFHQQKELVCPYCDKKYKDASYLGNHIGVTHKGEPAFQCEICGRFYTSKKSLASHRSVHDD